MRLFLVGAAVIVAAAAAIGAGVVRSPATTGVGLAAEQTVPFSHKHHAGELGIDCRYCHVNAETGADAGLPPTHTCMTCHSQIWTGAAMLSPVRESFASGRPLRWRRVAQLPDYVYFDHHVHVNNGVACVECHGRIDEMPLTWRAKPFTMRFCRECHEHPAASLRPPGMVTRMDWSGAEVRALRAYGARASARKHIDRARLVNCETCHR